MDGTAILSTGPGGKLIQHADALIVHSSIGAASNWHEALLDCGLAKVRVAGSCAEALEEIRKARPSCIVVALQMAEAFALMGALIHDADEWLRDIPILLVANRPSRATLLAATQAGFDVVLVEPVSARQIYRSIASLIQRARVSSRVNKAPQARERTVQRKLRTQMAQPRRPGGKAAARLGGGKDF